MSNRTFRPKLDIPGPDTFAHFQKRNKLERSIRQTAKLVLTVLSCWQVGNLVAGKVKGVHPRLTEIEARHTIAVTRIVSSRRERLPVSENDNSLVPLRVKVLSESIYCLSAVADFTVTVVHFFHNVHNRCARLDVQLLRSSGEHNQVNFTGILSGDSGTEQSSNTSTRHLAVIRNCSAHRTRCVNQNQGMLIKHRNVLGRQLHRSFKSGLVLKRTDLIESRQEPEREHLALRYNFRVGQLSDNCLTSICADSCFLEITEVTY